GVGVRRRWTAPHGRHHGARAAARSLIRDDAEGYLPRLMMEVDHDAIRRNTLRVILIGGLGLFVYLIMAPFVLRWFGFELTVRRCFGNTIPCGWESDLVVPAR